MAHEDLSSLPAIAELSALPERLEAKNVEMIQESANQIKAIKKRGNLPYGIHDLPTLSIGPEMTLEERLRVVEQNQAIFYDVLNNPQLKGVIQPKKPMMLEWSPDGEDQLRTVLTRLTPDLTLMENIYLDRQGKPYHLRPQLWASRRMIEEFLAIHREDFK